MNVSIVVAPRERFSSLPESLQSLFKTIPPSIRVIAVEGCSPAPIREDLAALQEQRPFELISLEHFVVPQEARNIGFERVDTEYVIFTENDIHYQQGWLEALYANAQENKSDIVAPLICIGPPAAKIIHHAGGRLLLREAEAGHTEIKEEHRLMDQPFATANAQTAPKENQVVEFHCFLTRSDYIRKVGPLNERLITREQIDFGLRAQYHQATITFELNSVVTYMAKQEFDPADLAYFAFRWSDELALRSLETFRSCWKLELDDQRILNRWIRPHRLRAFASAYPERLQAMGPRTFQNEFVRAQEQRIMKVAMATRTHLGEPQVPGNPDPARLAEVMSGLEKETDPGPSGEPISAEPSGATDVLPRLVLGGSQERPLRVAGMATMPSRFETFQTALDSILPQVDRLFLFCDRFAEESISTHPKIIILESQKFGDLRANGKFLGLNMTGPGCYYFSVDDDILYPPDYVEKFVTFLSKHNNKVVAGAHASILNQSFSLYTRDRRIVHRSLGLDKAYQVDVLGTCTTAFHTSLLKFDIRNWKKQNMVDLHFALECQERGIPRVAIPRANQWIHCIQENQADSIFRALNKNSEFQTELAKKLKPVRRG